jgi:hypothetical protein
MSEQLRYAIEIINQYDQRSGGAYSHDESAPPFMDGMSSLLGDIECSDDELVILVSVGIATQQCTAKYSVDLARDVRGREAAALGTAAILEQAAREYRADIPAHILCLALAMELRGVVGIVGALDADPSDTCRALLDGPLG